MCEHALPEPAQNVSVSVIDAHTQAAGTAPHAPKFRDVVQGYWEV